MLATPHKLHKIILRSSRVGISEGLCLSGFQLCREQSGRGGVETLRSYMLEFEASPCGEGKGVGHRATALQENPAQAKGFRPFLGKFHALASTYCRAETPSLPIPLDRQHRQKISSIRVMSLPPGFAARPPAYTAAAGASKL